MPGLLPGFTILSTEETTIHLKDIIHIPVKALSVLVDQQGLSATLRDLAIVARDNGQLEKAEKIELLADDQALSITLRDLAIVARANGQLEKAEKMEELIKIL